MNVRYYSTAHVSVLRQRASKLRLEAKQQNSKHLPNDPASDKRGDINMNTLRQILGDDKVLQLQRYAKVNDPRWRQKKDLLKILEQAGSF